MSDRHHVAIGILIMEQRILLCRRRADREWYPGVWDLPGGHIEPNESPAVALRRELHEELGIATTPDSEPLVGVMFDDVEADVWALRSWTGTPVNAAREEHDEIAWFTLEELGELEIAHATIHDLCRLALDAD